MKLHGIRNYQKQELYFQYINEINRKHYIIAISDKQQSHSNEGTIIAISKMKQFVLQKSKELPIYSVYSVLRLCMWLTLFCKKCINHYLVSYIRFTKQIEKMTKINEHYLQGLNIRNWKRKQEKKEWYQVSGTWNKFWRTSLQPPKNFESEMGSLR